MATVPDDLVHLLEDPNYGHPATVRPDGSPPPNPMGFLSDPESAFHPVLGARHGNPEKPLPPERADRVIPVMSIDKVTRK